MLDYHFFYIISIPIYILLLLIFIGKKVNINKIIISSLFYFYVISLITVTIFPIPIQGLNEIRAYGSDNNFTPFVSILDILFNDNLSFIIKCKQIIGNVVLFIPMGFFLPLIWKGKKVFKKALLVGILGSFSIELTQYIISLLLGFNYKVTDVDDIFLNTLGFIIGFFLYKIFQKSFLSKNLN